MNRLALACTLYVAGMLTLYGCASLFGGAQPPPLDAPPLTAEETPVGKIAGGFESLAGTLNSVNQDGAITVEESAQVQRALQDFGKTAVESVQLVETRLRAEIKQAQEAGGSINWPATLLQVGLTALLGGGVGFQAVRKAPNRMILGTEPDPEVARVAATT